MPLLTRYNGDSMWTWRNLGGRAKLPSFLATKAHQAGSSRRFLTGVRLSESVRCHVPGLALLTIGGVQQQQNFEADEWSQTLP
ncbi:hypothetical protein TNCV_3556061 [Trichonephila clavipes]|nr:hypothetical protein TNCV_3556061 [Trichonephila clavipes]